MSYTHATKLSEISHNWHLIDVNEKILGRIATEIAETLMGKQKPYYVSHLDCGEHVVVINAKNIRVTGKKLIQKTYTKYSGYPGGLHKESLGHFLNRKPDDVMRIAVTGMLPKNKLRDALLKRLYIYANDKHPYAEKFQASNLKSQTIK